MLLRNHAAGEVQRRTADVSVNIHPSGKHEAAGYIEHRGIRGQLRYNPPFLADTNISHLAVTTVAGVIHLSALDPQHS
jgi:hypothetical protein